MNRDLNPLAVRVSAALTRIRPEFATSTRMLEDGDIELFIEAGGDSKAGALVVSTARGEDIWIRFAPPQMCYCVDNEEELLAIVDALLDERVMFVRIAGPQDEWTGTTLVAQGALIDLQTGEKATVRSWSGRFDQELVANTPGASWLEFHDSELLAVDTIDSGVELRLEAYVHAWDTGAVPRRGTGFVQPVRITLSEARAPAIVDGLPLSLSGGQITAGGECYDDLVPLPFTAIQPALVRVELATGTVVEVVGATVEVSATGPARYVEDLPVELWPGPVQPHGPEKHNATQHAVAIVVDRAFSTQLDDLAERIHVWIIDTPENRVAAERVWERSGRQYSFERGVTTFTANIADVPEQNAADILATVEEHHGVERHDPPCSRIEVFGAKPEARVRAEFEAWGYTELTPTPAGFVALRR